MRSKALFVTLALFAILPALATATPSDESYDRLFGTESKTVERAKPKDKLTFARKLVLAAGETKEDKSLQALLYGKAFDFAITSSEGYPVAADAMAMLVKAQPNLKTTADERLLTLNELKFRTARGEQKPVIAGELVDVAASVASAKARHGDLEGAQAVLRRVATAAKLAGKDQSAAFDARTKQLSARITASKRIAQLTAKPADSAGRTELATLLLIEADKPTEAVQAAKDANDNGLARIATLASKKPIELKPAELKDLADWYYAKSKTAGDWGKRRALQHAEILYSALLQREGLSDVDRLGAKLPHAEVEKALRALLGPESWISKNATYRASSRDHDHPPLAAFLTYDGDLYKQSFAFHTSEGVGDCVTIDLGSARHLSHIWIENRKEPDFYERAAGLSIWLSSKAGDKGEKVWTASKAGKDWDVPMDGRQARFITIGFPEAGLLHLAHAKVFGFGTSIDDEEESDAAPVSE